MSDSLHGVGQKPRGEGQQLHEVELRFEYVARLVRVTHNLVVEVDEFEEDGLQLYSRLILLVVEIQGVNVYLWRMEVCRE